MPTLTQSDRRFADPLVAAVTLLTAGFGAVALLRPQTLIGDPPTPGQRYYSRMYAARALPLAAAVLATQACGAPNRPLLLTAAAAQLGDVAIGLARRNPGQVFPPLAGALLYAWRARGER